MKLYHHTNVACSNTDGSIGDNNSSAGVNGDYYQRRYDKDHIE